jgi:hypothetical protein
VTIRPLPDIDLARIAPQPRDMKRKSLEQMRAGRPPFSYKPLRSCFDDIFNIQPELDFGTAAPTPWATIEAALAKRSADADEFEHNKRVARGLHDFATSGRVIGRKHEFFPLAMGAGRKVTYWQSMIADGTAPSFVKSGLDVDDKPGIAGFAVQLTFTVELD